MYKEKITLSNLKQRTKCCRCGKTSIIHDFSSGEIYCNYCGMIIEQKTSDLSYDSKAHDYENDVRHTGTPTTIAIHDYGLSTVSDKYGISEISASITERD